MDYVYQGKVEGSVASYLAKMGRVDPGVMRPWVGEDGRTYVTVYKGHGDPKKGSSHMAKLAAYAGTLRRDEWKQLDEAVLGIARQRLVGIQDLIDNNLVYNLGNAMGTTVLEWHTVSDSMEATMTMDGVTRSQGDRPVYTTKYMPIPIIHADFEINARVLAASRNMGNPLDVTAAENAARKVAEKLEDLLFTATSYKFGEGTIYSYLNETDRNTVSLGTNWDASAKTGAQIITDVLNMKQASIDANHFGPWMLYVPTAYETVLDDDYDSTTPGTTIRERILKIDGIKGVKVIDRLTANNVILVEMNAEVVRLVNGMGIRTVEWSTEGGMVTKYKVMAIQVPQVRADQDGNSGVVHLS
jgi:uncharacterized linocin/CFP29 family protein